MKKLLNIILAGGFLFVATSCEPDFLDVNTNPNASVDVPPGTVMTNALLSISQVRLTTTNADGAAYVQQHKPVVVLTAPDTYGFSSIGNNNFYRFTFYGRTIKDLNLAALIAETNGLTNGVAQLRILQAWAWIQGADRWGEIPFVQANDPEFQFPEFDTGDVIYQGIIDIIDNALALMDPTDQSTAITANDLVFGGDLNSWVRFANSLKLRVLMRLSYVEDRAADIAALLSSGDFIDAVDGSEDAMFQYVAARNNQNFDYATFDNFVNFGSFAVVTGGSAANPADRIHQRWRLASDAMVTYLDGLSDPRMFSFFQRDAGNASGPIEGAVNGAAALPDQVDRGYVSLYYIRQDKADDWFLASEYHLLAAEAYARGLAPGGIAAAQTALENGVNASMNVFDGTAYEIAAADKATFIASLNLSALADPVSFIQEQQWVALNYNGTEAWANWRRTKRPVLTPAVGGDITTVISRIELPEDAFLNPNAPDPAPLVDEPVYFERP